MQQGLNGTGFVRSSFTEGLLHPLRSRMFSMPTAVLFLMEHLRLRNVAGLVLASVECQCHAFQRLTQGDLNTLSSSTAWSQLVLKEKEVSLWSDDQKGAFYAWELPQSWPPFMCFAWPVPGHLVGSVNVFGYVASRVIPMGLIQAVSLFQRNPQTTERVICSMGGRYFRGEGSCLRTNRSADGGRD